MTNLAYNCLDHHVRRGRGGQTALAYVNERGERRALHLRAAPPRGRDGSPPRLRGMGIRKGDRITVYMPTLPRRSW
jgi:acyl-coenzyme A synthetase/AMP-(fatty) acid ligase